MVGEIGAEYKLTLLDGDMTIAPGSGVTKSGNMLTVPYSISGNNSGNVTQVSVLILDKKYTAGNTNGAKVLAYDKLNVDNFSTSGKGTFPIPDSLSGKKAGTDYHVYLIAEDVNEEKETDYASTPVEIYFWDAPTVKQMNYGTLGIIDPAVPNSTGDAWKGCYVYYGNYDADGDGTAEPVKYRVLDAGTTDYSADGTTQTMFLDCDSILYNIPFDSDRVANEVGKKANDWSISDVKKSLNGEGFLNKDGVFSTAEKNAIIASTVASHALTTDSGTEADVTDKVQGRFVNYVALTGEQIFLLDIEDVLNGAYGYRIIDSSCANCKKNGVSMWWLRSAHWENYAGCVGTSYYNCSVHYDFIGVSPAMNLNLSSVLFSSATSFAGKSSALTSESTKIGTEANTEWKLTLKDTEKSVALTEGRSVTKASDGTITVPYTYTDKENATDSENVNQISVMITDKAYDAEKAANAQEAQILYYGALQDIKDAEGNDSTVAESSTGTGTFTLPSNLTGTLGTDYHIYLLAEHVNADNSTDYASEPMKVEKIYLDISEAMAVQSNTLTYDGTEKAPEFTITFGDDVLSEDDYEIETALQKNVGTYTATIKGKGDYSGEITDVSWSIGKTAPAITWNDQTIASTGEEVVITAPTLIFVGNDEPEVELAYSYKAQKDAEYTAGLPSDCGTYDVKVNVSATDNYSAVEDTMTLTITCTDADNNGFCDHCSTYDKPELVGEYYQIANADNLMWFAQQVNVGETAINAKLTADIAMNGIDWTIMSSFAGTFDGNGHTISGLNGHIDMWAQNQCHGFIRTLDNGGFVKNLTFTGAKVFNHEGGGAISAIIVYTNHGTVENCLVKSSNIHHGGYDTIGVVVGANRGTIRNCASISNTMVRRFSSAKAICGFVWTNSGSIENCFNYDCTYQNGSNRYAFTQSNTGTITNCYYYESSETISDTVVTAKTAEAFASGEVAYLLNGEKTDGTQSWYQTLKTDTYPVPGNTHGTVYSIFACDGTTPAGYSNKNKNEPHIDENGDEYCDNCGVIYNGIGAHLAGYSVSLNGSIGVNFHMDLTQDVLDDNEAYMLFTLPNGTTQKVMVSDAKAKETAVIEGKTYYIFTCNVAAKEMTDTIQAQLITSDGSKTQVYEYSVREYAEKILSGNYDAGTQELVKAMLHYGAYSQEWFDYNTTNLANAGLETLDLSEANDWDGFDPIITNDDEVGSFTSAYLTLESNTAINLKFKLADGVSFEDLRVVVEDPLGNVVPVTTVTTENVCLITLTGIKASDLDTTYSFCVTDGEGNESSILYSAMSYACAVANSEMDQKLKNVTAALRVFNLRANEKFEY